MCENLGNLLPKKFKLPKFFTLFKNIKEQTKDKKITNTELFNLSFLIDTHNKHVLIAKKLNNRSSLSC